MVTVSQDLGRGHVVIKFLNCTTFQPVFTYDLPPEQALEFALRITENSNILVETRTMRPDFGVTQQRIDDRLNGGDEERKRIMELQGKTLLTEGERMELQLLLQRCYPASITRG